MVQGSAPADFIARSSLECDYEYDKSNDIFLFYPSRPAIESSRDGPFLTYPAGFYNLPIFRNDRDHLLLPLCQTESVYSGRTAVAYKDDDYYGREGNAFRSMGYSRCFCLGLASLDVPDRVHPHTSIPTPAQGRFSFSFGSLLAKLWDRFLRR